jgi:hypothetical protein
MVAMRTVYAMSRDTGVWFVSTREKLVTLLEA